MLSISSGRPPKNVIDTEYFIYIIPSPQCGIGIDQPILMICGANGRGTYAAWVESNPRKTLSAFRPAAVRRERLFVPVGSHSPFLTMRFGDS